MIYSNCAETGFSLNRSTKASKSLRKFEMLDETLSNMYGNEMGYVHDVHEHVYIEFVSFNCCYGHSQTVKGKLSNLRDQPYRKNFLAFPLQLCFSMYFLWETQKATARFLCWFPIRNKNKVCQKKKQEKASDVTRP